MTFATTINGCQMNKQKEALYKIGDVVCVIEPTMAINLKVNEETKKYDIEEIMLVGDEGLIVEEVEFVKRTNDYLYKVLTGNDLDAKIYSLSEEVLTPYNEEVQ